MSNLARDTRYFIVRLGFLAAALPVLAGCGGGAGGSATPLTAGSSSSTSTRSVALSFGVTGVRGYVPVAVQVNNNKVAFEAINDGGTQQWTGDPSATIHLTVPDGYGDRQFLKWQRGGQDVGAGVSLSFTAAQLPGSGALTAIYGTRASAIGQFAPNYSKPEYPHWTQFPVHVFLNSTVVPGSDKEASIKTGLNRWVTASGGIISYDLVTDSTKADIEIGFGATAAGVAGFCDTTWDGHNQMTKAIISLNPPVATSQFEVVTQNLETIAAHEFGHALGLTGPEDGAGHSPDSGDTMYVTGNSQIGLISERDMNTISNVYPDLFSGSAAGRSVSVGGGGRKPDTQRFTARVF